VKSYSSKSGMGAEPSKYTLGLRVIFFGSYLFLRHEGKVKKKGSAPRKTRRWVLSNFEDEGFKLIFG
jgi:hypothetical protein